MVTRDLKINVTPMRSVFLSSLPQAMFFQESVSSSDNDNFHTSVCDSDLDADIIDAFDGLDDSTIDSRYVFPLVDDNSTENCKRACPIVEKVPALDGLDGNAMASCYDFTLVNDNSTGNFKRAHLIVDKAPVFDGFDDNATGSCYEPLMCMGILP